MGFSKKALKARAKVRKEARSTCGYVDLLGEGERAYLKGQGKDANPYQSATEEAEIWLEGWQDAHDVYGKS